MTNFLDVVAWPLDKAQEHLKEIGYNCSCIEIPVVENKKNDNGCYVKYVVRQEVFENTKSCNLLICSKFRKEVQ